MAAPADAEEGHLGRPVVLGQVRLEAAAMTAVFVVRDPIGEPLRALEQVGDRPGSWSVALAYADIYDTVA